MPEGSESPLECQTAYVSAVSTAQVRLQIAWEVKGLLHAALTERLAVRYDAHLRRLVNSRRRGCARWKGQPLAVTRGFPSC